MNILDIEAMNQNLPKVLGFIDKQLARFGCENRVRTQIDIAAEEIFVNIASYAYHPEIGPAQIRVEIREKPLAAVISFSDHGKQYNPLERPDPDVKAPAAKRQKGGLGIYMVKKSMDGVTYEYRDGLNILTITKNIG